jgi:hypothetical protein
LYPPPATRYLPPAVTLLNPLECHHLIRSPTSPGAGVDWRGAVPPAAVQPDEVAPRAGRAGAVVVQPVPQRDAAAALEARPDAEHS